MSIKQLLAETIAAERIDCVLAAVASVFQGKMPEQFSLLEGGYSASKTFKMQLADKSFVLRVMTFTEDLADRKQQVACFKAAADIGLAPICHYANPEEGILIMDYIASTSVRQSSTHLHDVAKMLQALHSLSVEKPAYGSLFSYISDYIQRLSALPLCEKLQTFFLNINAIQKILEPHWTECFCHNDLNGNNILFDGKKIYLIDWEAAGNSDPYFDLATFCNQFICDEKKENDFLQMYFQHQYGNYQQAKIFLMKQISFCFHAIHFFDFATQSGLSLADGHMFADLPSFTQWVEDFRGYKITLKAPQDFLLYANVLVETSVRQIASAQYQWAKEILFT